MAHSLLHGSRPATRNHTQQTVLTCSSAASLPAAPGRYKTRMKIRFIIYSVSHYTIRQLILLLHQKALHKVSPWNYLQTANNFEFLPQGLSDIVGYLYKRVWCFGQFKHWLKDAHISKELRIITVFDVSNKPANVISQCKISSANLSASTQVTSKFFYSAKIKTIIQVQINY